MHADELLARAERDDLINEINKTLHIHSLRFTFLHELILASMPIMHVRGDGTMEDDNEHV